MEYNLVYCSRQDCDCQATLLFLFQSIHWLIVIMYCTYHWWPLEGEECIINYLLYIWTDCVPGVFVVIIVGGDISDCIQITPWCRWPLVFSSQNCNKSRFGKFTTTHEYWLEIRTTASLTKKNKWRNMYDKLNTYDDIHYEKYSFQCFCVSVLEW